MWHEAVFLAATDTTIGFLSQSTTKLDSIKKRPSHKKYIRAVDSLATLRTLTRVPKAHKRRVRRAKRTTFILPTGESFRVVDDATHLLLLRRLRWAYTTSANESGKDYDEAFAKDAADIIVAPLQAKHAPSTIYRLGKERIRKVR